jgi:molybdopterin/thiamine biosynthesis adenylyltransferase
MQRITPDLDPESVYEAIETFIDGGFVEDAGAPPPAGLTAAELARYDRNTNYFSWVDVQPRPSPYEHQRRLKNASVTVLGLGGTGSAVAMSLAAAGVGSLHCVDFDRVEEANLNRQLLYTEDDIGRPKVEAAVARLRRLNSHVNVTGQEVQVQSSDDIAPLAEGRDLLVLCADTPPEQIYLWTNEAALRTNTPWLVSAYAGPMLVVGIYVPFETPCYQCLNHDQAQKRVARDGSEAQALLAVPVVNAVIAPTANLTGHLGALEAVYFLTGLQPQTRGRVFHQNLMIYDHFYYVEPPFWAECPACGPESPYRQAREQARSPGGGGAGR